MTILRDGKPLFVIASGELVAILVWLIGLQDGHLYSFRD